MIPILKAVLENAKGNKVATAFGVVAFCAAGAGKLMSENGVEPWGSAATGIAAFIAIGLGFAVPKLLPPKNEGE